MAYPHSDSGHSHDTYSHSTGVDNPYEHLAPLSASARTVAFQDPDPFASTPSLHSTPSVTSLRTDPFASSTSLASTITTREYDLGTREGGATEEDESLLEKEPLTKKYSVSLSDTQWSSNEPGENSHNGYYPPSEYAPSCTFARFRNSDYVSGRRPIRYPATHERAQKHAGKASRAAGEGGKRSSAA